MATVKPTITFIGNDTVKFAWNLTQANAVGYPVGPNHADYADRSVQVTGTFGGATVVLQGSNDGEATLYTLDDPQGNDLSFSAAGGKGVSEVPELTRPFISAGASGTTDLTIYLTCRRSRG